MTVGAATNSVFFPPYFFRSCGPAGQKKNLPTNHVGKNENDTKQRNRGNKCKRETGHPTLAGTLVTGSVNRYTRFPWPDLRKVAATINGNGAWSVTPSMIPDWAYGCGSRVYQKVKSPFHPLPLFFFVFNVGANMQRKARQNTSEPIPHGVDIPDGRFS